MLILTVTTTPERMNNLMNTTRTVDKAYFFLFTTFNEIKEKDVISGYIWKTPGKEELIKLL